MPDFGRDGGGGGRPWRVCLNPPPLQPVGGRGQLWRSPNRCVPQGFALPPGRVLAQRRCSEPGSGDRARGAAVAMPPVVTGAGTGVTMGHELGCASFGSL